jgi:2-amino-4-hydroxy-6-hydroxymethyldihydropteridine diphosphokinase
MSRNIAYIGIGSNLGNALQNVGEAIDILRDLPDTRLDRLSSLYRTAPIDATGDDYVNAVARLITGLSPDNLLHALWNIENRLGRERPYRNAPRTLDLDILLYNADQINTRQLTIPHPRMAERAFVLVPLAEIDPNVEIPGKEKLSVLLNRLKDQRIDLLDN